MKFLQLIFFVVFHVLKITTKVQSTTVKMNNHIDGYYWRDYTGIIPNDAVPAGRDETGATTFIGQALRPGGKLTPGIIKRGIKEVSYEYGNKGHLAGEDVKILCSQRQEQLMWFHVGVGNSTLNLNGNQVIRAGTGDQGPLAIGRRDSGIEVGVGKALFSGTEIGPLWYTSNNEFGFVIVNDWYEVLVFKPEIVGKKDDDCARRVININFLA